MKIKIKEQEIELFYSLRNFIIFENIVGSSFEPSSLNNIITFFYSVIVGSLQKSKINMTIDFDEFMDFIDENPQIFDEFNIWMEEQISYQNSLRNKLPDEKSDKKKVTQKKKVSQKKLSQKK